MPQSQLLVIPALKNDEIGVASRRRVYILAMLLGVLLMLLALAFGNPFGFSEPYIRLMAPLSIVLGLLDIWWLASGRSLRVAEVGGYITLAVLCVVQVAIVSFTPQPPGFYPNSGPYWMLVCVAAIGFVAFHTTLAGRLTTVLTFTCLLLPWLVNGSYVTQNPVAVLRMQLSASVVVLLIWGLSWFRGQYIDQVQSQKLLHKLAFTDFLTGLPNRRAAYPAVAELLREAQVGRPGTLLLVDVDHFKRINDVHGHVAGDEMLVHVARLLRTAAPELDVLPRTVSRWGGEEFIVVLPGTTLQQAQACAEAFRQAFHRYNWPLELQIRASFGGSQAREHDDVSALLARADQALYHAKTTGRDRVVMYEQELLDVMPEKSFR